MCSDKECNARDITERKLCENLSSTCQPNVKCDFFGPCTFLEEATDIFLGKIQFRGIKERVCHDLNKCIPDFTEQASCVENYSLKLKPKTECGEDYLFMVDPVSDRPIAKIKLASWENNRLDIVFVQDYSAYCPSCYNGKKDENEEKIDCGGSCKPCAQESNLFMIILVIFFWSVALISIFLIARDLFSHKRRHKREDLISQEAKFMDT
jgi:hypothetical protein